MKSSSSIRPWLTHKRSRSHDSSATQKSLRYTCEGADMKKAILIAAGTVTGLGAVLSITPPALSGTVSEIGMPSADPVAQATPTAKPTASATATATSAATPTKSATATATVKPTAAAVAPATGFSGTVNGASFRARDYGTVSVSATFSNGTIKSVSASQSPTSWSQQSFSVIIPYVNNGSITIEQVKQFSSAQLPCSTSNSCNSRASYTADAFWSSLKSAIAKAGL
jgi:hypothetical protein